ncbi:hypothetical protein [Streptomyces pratens]|uniref:Uncharacterized protein n=1 Tax=Streptomyces pratens TaxID=887456 RepID=A0ABW1M0M1_9ACTN
MPSSSVKAVERVPAHVRTLLRIDVYEVTDEGSVRPLPSWTRTSRVVDSYKSAGHRGGP